MAKAEITVNDKLYSVACSPGQEQRLKALGAQLDARVRQIASAVGDVGNDRIFLIAALSLLDELDAARAEAGGITSSLETQMAGILEQAAARIEMLAERADMRTSR